MTFDDGPSEWTSEVLNLLAEHGRKATFFVVGQSVAGHGKILERMFADGHTIGNHTFTHRRLTDLAFDEVWSEFRACNAVVQLACGFTPRVWRPPYMSRIQQIEKIARECGLTYMGVDIVPDDWQKDSAEEIAERVLSHAAAGAIVCLHDGIPPDGGNGTDTRQPTVDAVRLILDAGW